MRLGRSAKAIWQDLAGAHGFGAGYPSVKRFVRKPRSQQPPDARAVILTAPGEEAQVDYGEGPMVRRPETGKYRRTRLFVLTLGYSRKAVRLLTFRSGAGKSHLAQAIGRAVLPQGHKVLYREAHALAEEQADATVDGERKATMNELGAVPLLIIDDLGMRQLPATAAEDLLELAMRRYERASTLITSNRPVEDRGNLLADVQVGTGREYEPDDPGGPLAGLDPYPVGRFSGVHRGSGHAAKHEQIQHVVRRKVEAPGVEITNDVRCVDGIRTDSPQVARTSGDPLAIDAWSSQVLTALRCSSVVSGIEAALSALADGHPESARSLLEQALDDFARAVGDEEVRVGGTAAGLEP